MNSDIKTINISEDLLNVNRTGMNLIKRYKQMGGENNNQTNNSMNEKNNKINNQTNNSNNTMNEPNNNINNQNNSMVETVNNQINNQIPNQNNSINEPNNNLNNQNNQSNNSNNSMNETNNSGNEMNNLQESNPDEIEIVSSDDESDDDSEMTSDSEEEEDEMEEVERENLFFKQDKIRDEDLYKKYEDAIEVFFRKERSSDDFIRVTKDDMYIMIDKKNDKNKTIIIPPVIVNINKYYLEKEKKKNEIYNTISNIISDLKNEVQNKSKFNDLKQELSEINKETNSIKKVLDEQRNTINSLIKSETEGLFKLSELFFKRNQIYKKLEHKKINNNHITELLKIYKDNNREIPKDEFLKTLVDKMKLDFFNIKNALIWINTSREYIQLQGEVNRTKKELSEKRKLYEKINNNFIIKMPEVDDNKEVEVTINVPTAQKGGDMEENQEQTIKVIKIDDAHLGKIVGEQLERMKSEEDLEVMQ